MTMQGNAQLTHQLIGASVEVGYYGFESSYGTRIPIVSSQPHRSAAVYGNRHCPESVITYFIVIIE